MTPGGDDATSGGHPDPRPEPLTAVGTDRLACCLTFDDGPNGEDTERLLAALAERGILAVFCIVGSQIQRPGGAEVLRRIARDGHVIANHATSFDDMGAWSPERVRADLIENLRVIRLVLGENHPVPYWRAPNASWGRTCEVAVSLGMQPLGFSSHIEDWVEQDADVLAARLREAIVPGALVVLHDGGGDRAGTVDAAIRVVDELLARGWSFVLPSS
ncbi:polysaccharide deacetylase family protein [Demequina sp. NBRC 110053]|uniref:polysaccharide deacetylase family protein n=1 Tax=Demequina sp. NBRC 110053 TaxID=1570342 RepID=UPI00135650F3|nr:polysaccharide deacetylase family protein [Demequina sp. NBRC 110053]